MDEFVVRPTPEPRLSRRGALAHTPLVARLKEGTCIELNSKSHGWERAVVVTVNERFGFAIVEWSSKKKAKFYLRDLEAHAGAVRFVEESRDLEFNESQLRREVRQHRREHETATALQCGWLSCKARWVASGLRAARLRTIYAKSAMSNKESVELGLSLGLLPSGQLCRYGGLLKYEAALATELLNQATQLVRAANNIMGSARPPPVHTCLSAEESALVLAFGQSSSLNQDAVDDLHDLRGTMQWSNHVEGLVSLSSVVGQASKQLFETSVSLKSRLAEESSEAHPAHQKATSLELHRKRSLDTPALRPVFAYLANLTSPQSGGTAASTQRFCQAAPAIVGQIQMLPSASSPGTPFSERVLDVIAARVSHADMRELRYANLTAFPRTLQDHHGSSSREAALVIADNKLEEMAEDVVATGSLHDNFQARFGRVVEQSYTSVRRDFKKSDVPDLVWDAVGDDKSNPFCNNNIPMKLVDLEPDPENFFMGREGREWSAQCRITLIAAASNASLTDQRGASQTDQRRTKRYNGWTEYVGTFDKDSCTVSIQKREVMLADREERGLSVWTRLGMKQQAQVFDVYAKTSTQKDIIALTAANGAQTTKGLCMDLGDGAPGIFRSGLRRTQIQTRYRLAKNGRLRIEGASAVVSPLCKRVGLLAVSDLAAVVEVLRKTIPRSEHERAALLHAPQHIPHPNVPGEMIANSVWKDARYTIGGSTVGKFVHGLTGEQNSVLRELVLGSSGNMGWHARRGNDLESKAVEAALDYAPLWMCC